MVGLSPPSPTSLIDKLYLFNSQSAPIVLGHLWLVQHDPHMDWSGNSVLAWSQSCLASCLGSAISPGCVSPVLQVEAADLSGVPAEYHSLRQVFSKSWATSLPPQWPYDLTSSQALLCPWVTFIPCLIQKERLWASILMILSMLVSSVPFHCLLVLVSSLSR